MIEAIKDIVALVRESQEDPICQGLAWGGFALALTGFMLVALAHVGAP